MICNCFLEFRVIDDEQLPTLPRACIRESLQTSLVTFCFINIRVGSQKASETVSEG